MADLVTTCGFSHTYSLPLLIRLTHTTYPLYIKLDPVTYLVVATFWRQEGYVGENFHLLRVAPASFLPSADEEGIPKAFLKVESLIKLNPQQVFDQLSGTITGRCHAPIKLFVNFYFLVEQSSSKLKRKVSVVFHLFLF